MNTLTRIDLILALAACIGFFALCYGASPRKSVPALICLIPFQPISSQLGTLNVLLVYVMAVAFMLRGRISLVPLGGVVLLVLGAYLISTGFADPRTRVDHAVYIFNLGSAFLLFYLVYNFVRSEQDVGLIVKTLIVMNVLVLLYCGAQTFLGRVSFFGIEELSITGRRWDGRLQGPFLATGITAEYLVLSILLFCYLLIDAKARMQKLGLYALIGINLLFLIATANRGGFLVLIGAGAWFLYLFKSQLGMARAVGLGVAGLILLSVASLIIINFTDFPALLERLESTEIDESGVPDTRIKTWSGITPLIQERPVVGHGPNFYGPGDEPPYPGFENPLWPHNLYLYLLYTIGSVGLLAWGMLFVALIVRIAKASKVRSEDRFTQGLVKLGTIMIPVILIDQLKVEFLRLPLTDYWHFLFAIFGIWLALADSLRLQAAAGVGESARSRFGYRLTPAEVSRSDAIQPARFGVRETGMPR